MTDIEKAIAALRDSVEAHYDQDAQIVEDARGILAAIDAARGEVVAYALPKALAETRADGFTVVRAGHQHHADGTYCVPLYAAPPALQAELDHARRRIGELTIQLGEAMQAPPAAAAPKGMVMVQRRDLEALAMTDFGRSFWCDGAELAARRIRAMLAAANKENE